MLYIFLLLSCGLWVCAVFVQIINILCLNNSNECLDVYLDISKTIVLLKSMQTENKVEVLFSTCNRNPKLVPNR